MITKKFLAGFLAGSLLATSGILLGANALMTSSDSVAGVSDQTETMTESIPPINEKSTAYSNNQATAAKEQQFAREVLALVNNERAKVGVAPLVLTDTLNREAHTRAEEIPQQFDHVRLDGSSFKTVFSQEYRMVGENLEAGARTPEDVVKAWMNSKKHRENILRPDFEEMGLGYIEVDDEYHYYWAQLFRKPLILKPGEYVIGKDQ